MSKKTLRQAKEFCLFVLIVFDIVFSQTFKGTELGFPLPPAVRLQAFHRSLVPSPESGQERKKDETGVSQLGLPLEALAFSAQVGGA